MLACIIYDPVFVKRHLVREGIIVCAFDLRQEEYLVLKWLKYRVFFLALLLSLKYFWDFLWHWRLIDSNKTFLWKLSIVEKRFYIDTFNNKLFFWVVILVVFSKFSCVQVQFFADQTEIPPIFLGMLNILVGSFLDMLLLVPVQVWSPFKQSMAHITLKGFLLLSYCLDILLVFFLTILYCCISYRRRILDDFKLLYLHGWECRHPFLRGVEGERLLLQRWLGQRCFLAL